MRKLLILSVVLLVISGCAGPQFYTTYVDYSTYNDFFVSESNSVSFEYLPLGSVSVTYTGYPLVVERTLKDKISERKSKSDDVYYDASDRDDESPFTSSHKRALDETIAGAVKKAKEMGANGIINFNSEAITNKYGHLNGWIVTGMAIKR